MNIKRIINLIDFDPIMMDVPSDWERCSVTGEFRPPEEFYNVGDNRKTRTNCTRSYMMSSEETRECKEKTRLVTASRKFANLTTALAHSINYNENSVSIDEMLSALQELKLRHPSARLIATQAGYYAEGNLAEVYTNFSKPEETIGNTVYFELSNSTQRP